MGRRPGNASANLLRAIRSGAVVLLALAMALSSLTACGPGAPTTAAGPSSPTGGANTGGANTADPPPSGSPTLGDGRVEPARVVPAPRTPINVPTSWPRVQSKLGWSFALPPGWTVLEDGGLRLPRLKDAGRGVGRLLKHTVIAREGIDDARWPPILTVGALPRREHDLDRLAAEFRELLAAPEGSDDTSSEVRTGGDAAPGELALVSVPLEGGRRFGASVMWVVPRPDGPWLTATTLAGDWERDGRTLTRIVASLR